MVLRLKIGLNSPAPFILFLNLSTEHALSTAHCLNKKLMFIGVINKRRLLLLGDSLLIRCDFVLIEDASVQTHRP